MLPIRWRLTLGYSFFLALALVGLGVAVYVLLSHNLEGEIDRSLALKTAEVQRAIRITGETLPPQIGVEELDTGPRRLSLPEPFVQLLDAQGAVVVTSPNLKGQHVPLDPAVIIEALEGKPGSTTLAIAEGQRVRLLTTPVIHGERVVGVVQVGQSLYTLDSSLKQVAYLLALGVFITWVLFSLGGWLVAGRALHPVSQISQAAERIGATGDFGQRISYYGPKDELGDLATTFNRMIERIQRAFEAQRQFVADASHELGSPLTVIRGNLDLLKRGLPADDQMECQRSMEGEAARMDRIIGDLLTLAQMNGYPRSELGKVRLDQLVQQVHREAQFLAGKRRISLEQYQPAMVLGDSHQLTQAIFNLVDNAVKYTPESGSITLSVLKSGQWALVRVADTGIGIPPEELPRIFDRFYRVDKARSRSKGGTGLGLPIVKAIAEYHGGRVTVESAPASGSVFTLWLPVATPHLAEERVPFDATSARSNQISSS